MKVGHVGKQPHRFPWRRKSHQGFRKMSRNFKIQVTNFDKYEFVLGEKIAHGTRRPGIGLSDSSDMPIENQSTHM